MARKNAPHSNWWNDGTWLQQQAQKCIDAMRSACGGEIPGTLHVIAIGAQCHDLTMSYIHRPGPAKGVVLEHIDGSRLAVVFFGVDVWDCYRVAIHEWAEHLMRTDYCEPCVTKDSPCDMRHMVADITANHCLAAAQAVRTTACSLVLQPEQQQKPNRVPKIGRRTQPAFLAVPAPI